ncbi:hypothetical protein GCM10011611_25250 [Aliidongia dinghuensis]|uniref:Uncharacterized protein n=1 Tax=Aliidongia dinghuensis TaxID=1867774 RepID=A0A8J2YTQ9_9PROT|nr:hypothetical protein GCM10011611_25250 [Aliidongia dinghuensis]
MLSLMSTGAHSSAAGSVSVIATDQPARAKTTAQERPINPAPMTAAFGMAFPPDSLVIAVICDHRYKQDERRLV